MRKCKVVNRQLVVNGRALQPGEELSLPAEDAALLIARGRLADTGDPAPPSKPETAGDAAGADVDEEVHSSEDEPAEPEQKNE